MRSRDVITFLLAILVQGCGLAMDTGYVPLDASEDWGVDPTMDAAPPGDAEWGDVDEGAEGWEEECEPCEEAVGCDDGLYCTGVDECLFSEFAGEHCCKHNTVTCDPGDPCLVGSCVEEMGECITVPRDDDGDGHPPLDCGYGDCDDGDYSIHPGARERCDDQDNDCDGAIDEDAWTPDGVAIAVSDPAETPYSVSFAGGDASWAVAWLADGGSGPVVRAGVITPGSGGPTASISTVSTVYDTPMDVAVAASGAGFIVAWTTPREGEGMSIKGLTMSADGTVTGGEVTVLSMAMQILDLDVAVARTSGRVGFFLRSDLNYDYEIYMLDVAWPPTTVAWGDNLDRITWAAGFSGRPSAAGIESGFAVAWEDDRDGNSEVYFATLSDTGALAGPARRITSAPGDSQHASLAASGSGFGLAWMDSRAGGYDMLFTCLAPGGARTCPELSVGAGPEKAWYPSVMFDGHGDQYALAYAGLESGLFHVALTAVAPSSSPPPEEIDPGRDLDGERPVILDPGVADTATHRGVLWLENDGGSTSTVVFQQLKCEEEE